MATFRFELGPVPLHHQVYVDLRRGLDEGRWAAGDRLPPERELAVHYGCSLITVRRALSELAREGRIERARGRGTTVLRPLVERDFAEALSFTAEMERRGLRAATRVVGARPESATELVARALDIERGSPVVAIERLRLGGGEPMLLEQAHLPAERFPGLLAFDLAHESLYDVLAEHYGTRVVRAREALEAVRLPGREAELLGARRGDPALLIDGVAFATDGAPVEASRTYVRGDRTRYYVERSVFRPDRVGSVVARQPEEESRHADPEPEDKPVGETAHA